MDENSLPSGNQWTDEFFPQGDWDGDDDYNPLDDHPGLSPGGGANCYPGHPGGQCHPECYIFTDAVHDAWICAIRHLMICPDTEVIVFVGTRQGNNRHQCNVKGARDALMRRLRNLAPGPLPHIGVKNSDHYATDWY